MTKKTMASRRTEDSAILLAEGPQTAPAARELQIPLSSQAVFWRPLHPVSSPMLGQLPFLFWLMETLRPACVVQSGLAEGLVYMALCQAAEKLSLGAAVYGLDAAPRLPQGLQSQHDAHYGDFSVLCPGDGAEALQDAGLPAGSEIDLLVLARPLDNAGVEAFRAEWLPRLSARGVLLICEPGRILPDPQARRLLLPADGQSLRIGSVGTGEFGLLATGRALPDRLSALMAQRPGDPAYQAVRQVFNRLGQGIVDMQRLAELGAAVTTGYRAVPEPVEAVMPQMPAGLPLTAEEETSRIALLELAHDERLQDIAVLMTERVAAIAERDRKIGTLTQEMQVLQETLRDAQAKRSAHWTRVEALMAENTRLRSESETDRTSAVARLASSESAMVEQRKMLADRITVLEAALTEAESKRSAHWTRVEALMAENGRIRTEIADERDAFVARLTRQQAEHDERLEDIVVLANERNDRLAERDLRITALEAALAEAQGKRSEHWARIEILMAENARLQEEVLAQQDRLRLAEETITGLYASTSWRLTKPMRAVKLALTSPRRGTSEAE